MGQVCEKHNEFYEKSCRWCASVVIGPAIRIVNQDAEVFPVSITGGTQIFMPCVVSGRERLQNRSKEALRDLLFTRLGEAFNQAREAWLEKNIQ